MLHKGRSAPFWKMKHWKRIDRKINRYWNIFSVWQTAICITQVWTAMRHSDYKTITLLWVRLMISIRTLFTLFSKIKCSLPLPLYELFISHHLAQKFQNVIVSLKVIVWGECFDKWEFSTTQTYLKWAVDFLIFVIMIMNHDLGNTQEWQMIID